MKLSVVIPAYNEEKDIREALLDVAKAFPDAEVIVVNDASTDNMMLVLQQFMIETAGKVNLRVIINERNRGHGYSVIRGLKEATGDYILYIDADRQIRLDTYPNIIEFADVLNHDIVSGWRVDRQDKPFRKVISFCLKSTNLLFHRMYIKDANCPFKIYKRVSVLALIDDLPDSYIVPIACLEVLARKSKLSTATIPTPHLPYEGQRKGFLQVLNKSALKFFSNAFFEVVSL